MQAAGILFLYNLAVYLLLPMYFLFGLLAACARPSRFRPWYARLGLGRGLKQLPKDALWLHAVSVGEVAATAIMIPALRVLLGERKIILSCVTAGGFEMAKKKLGKDFPVFYAPLDAAAIVRRFFRILRPKALAVAEMEIWPNLFGFAGRYNVPLVLYNARMPDKEWRRYARFKKVFARVLEPVRLIAAQSAEDASRYCDIGAAIDRIQVTGNIKNDLEAMCGASNAAQPGLLPGTEISNAKNPVIVLASSHRGEEKLVLDALEGLSAPSGRLRARLIIAPRDIRRARGIMRLAKRRGARARLRSEGVCAEDWKIQNEISKPHTGSGGSARGDVPGAGLDVFILDAIGELMAAYSMADIVIMGGSFTERVQGHNPLEAAAAGRPVIFGPYMENFKESRDALLAADAAYEAANKDALLFALGLWLGNPAEAQAAGDRARGVLEGMRGASRRAAFLIANYAR
jgi:3-deoxy-D-manno-octulosonic-acid transferase